MAEAARANADLQMVQEMGFLRRVEDLNCATVIWNEDKLEIIKTYEGKREEATRKRDAAVLVRELSMKVRPSEIIRGNARVGPLGTEFHVEPEKLQNSNVKDLVLDRVRMSKRKSEYNSIR